MKNIEVSKNQKIEITVQQEFLAKNVGSGNVEVFATPMMIAFMEKASAECLMEFLDEGETSVGTLVNVEHLSATPINSKVIFNANIVEVSGKIVTFSVEAYDEKELIGKGIHKRAIVNKQKFEQRTNDKFK